MDVTPPRHHDPAAGDDELAKVLAGVSDDPNEQPTIAAGNSGLQFEETPGPGGLAPSMPPRGSSPSSSMPMPEPAAQTTDPTIPPPVQIPATPTSTMAAPLEDIKRSALEELRPLVDKLNLPPEDKFDTLLLIIRSTDDQSLLPAAHEAARAIPDESKRAEALLDVIKEVDYFGSAQQPQ